ncbi:hypothetical protein BpHYR1_040726 [Brachionus plicatilis]|uniref:Uncharacterized protein n=1 Tax=Brachionus plicatilis TaxID=10195 RepID=A0A3M7P2T9_BRAPC|nr:hypothetical protein BpHYR1_040726 [Brachionus plicatilis]
MNSDRQESLQHNGAVTKRIAEKRDRESSGEEIENVGRRQPGRPRKFAKSDNSERRYVEVERNVQRRQDISNNEADEIAYIPQPAVRQYPASNISICLCNGKPKYLELIWDPNDVDTFEKLSFQKRKLFCKTNPEHYLLELSKLKRDSSESLVYYSLKISQIVRKAYPTIQDLEVLEKLKLESFIRGLPMDLASMVRIRKPNNLQEGLRFTEICDVDKGPKKKYQLLLNETNETRTYVETKKGTKKAKQHIRNSKNNDSKE